MGDFRINYSGLVAASVFIYLLFDQPVVASQREYIEAIKADVAEFSSGVFNAPEGNAWIDAAQLTFGAAGKKTESLESFSDFLKTESPGSHIFYKKLPPEFKQKIFEEYLTTGDLERTKKDILKYTSTGNK